MAISEPVIFFDRGLLVLTNFAHCSAWLQAKDLSKLQLHEIQAYINEPHKRNGDLLEGYKVALDPIAWEEKQKEKKERAEEMDEDEPVDELDEDGEGAEDDDEMEKINKRKRKREAKPKEKPAKDAKPPKSQKKKNGGKKSNAMVESEDEGGDAGPSSKGAPPPSKKSKHIAQEVKETNGADGEYNSFLLLPLYLIGCI